MSSKPEREGKPLEHIARDLGVGVFRTHVFLCSGPDCISAGEGEAAWKALKSEIKRRYPDLARAGIYRTRVKCLRMCTRGPIAVCYPQGIWFREVTASRIPELLDWLEEGARGEHPLQFARHPL
ncbi:MAG: (2Fe-2S) ferredoxin domain-containing protein [Deltaproteobacteria bacterium]|nr:(2Fe-2S) ferredoxin domain-containing protein [Deltaproteobacteria bacterium]